MESTPGTYKSDDFTLLCLRQVCRDCAFYNMPAPHSNAKQHQDDAVGLPSIIRLRKGRLQAETYQNFNLLTDLLRQRNVSHNAEPV